MLILQNPPAFGKTKHCVDETISTRLKSPHKNIWIISPDGYSAAYFRSRLVEKGPVLGVKVEPFSSLYREILEKAEKNLPFAPSAMTQKIIRNTIEDVHQEGNLNHFKKIRKKQGFANAMQSRVAELKRGLVKPEDLSKYAKNKKTPLQEISSIYSAYQKNLISMGWADSESLSWLAAEFLSGNPRWIPDWPLIVIDGFDSFTNPQFKIISLLNNIVGKIIITLPGKQGSERPEHRRANETLEKLQEIIEGVAVETLQKQYLSGPIKHLENNIGLTDTKAISGEGKVKMFASQSPVEETRETLRWIKNLIIRKGIKSDECAIIVPNGEIYNPQLRVIGEEFGLPLHFSQGKYLANTSLFTNLISLLKLSQSDYPGRLLIDTIRSPYFDLEKYLLGKRDADALDLASRFRHIVGGEELWIESLTFLESKEETYSSDEIDIAPNLPTGQQAKELKDGLQNFFDRLSVSNQKQSTNVWIAWLEELFEDIGIAQNQPLEEDQKALAGIRQLLRDLYLAETVVGETDISYQEFLSVLQDQASNIEISEDYLSSEKIVVLPITTGRGVRYKAVAVMGLSEGIFPKTQRSDPFLVEETRLALGMDSAVNKYQATLFYQAITRTDEYLLLSRPYLSSDGAIWEPSPYWDAVNNLLTEEPIVYRPEEDRNNSEAASIQEAMMWAIKNNRIEGHLKLDHKKRLARIELGLKVLESREDGGTDHEYNGNLKNISHRIEQKYGKNASWSASRLESYSTCPQMFYASNLLQLETVSDPELGFDPRQLGSLLHRVLERVYKEAPAEAGLPELYSTLSEVAEEEFSQAPEEDGFRPTPFWKEEQAELLVRLETTIEALQKESDGWKVVGFEEKFGLGNTRPLSININMRSIKIRGLIDRVDKNEDGEIRIIDYKTGSSKLSVKDLENGSRLQLPIYALAAQKTLQLGDVTDGFYWAINAAKKSPFQLKKYGFEKAVGVAKDHIKNIVTGVGEADFQPKTPKGGCPSYCPAAGWCWEYESAGSW